MRIFGLILAFFISTGTAAYAQADKIDLTQAPGSPAPVPVKKSNATLLKETTQPAETKTSTNINFNDPYQFNKIEENGTTSRTLMQQTPSYNSTNANQHQMMNAQQYKGNLGNIKTNSTIYFDNSGKIQGANTNIDFGK